MTGTAADYGHFVLVVDDDDQVLQVTAELIEQLGYEVLTASNGSEALDILEDHDEVGVLLSDIRMPGIDGNRLAELAHDLRPDLRIILTSGGNVSRVNVPFLPKPYRVADLMSVLRPLHAC